MNSSTIAEGQIADTVYFLKKTKIEESDTIDNEKKYGTTAANTKIKKGEALIHLMTEVTSLSAQR